VNIYILGAKKPYIGKVHNALHKIGLSNTILDLQIDSFSSIKKKSFTFIGGYKINEIKKKYPTLNFINIKDWEHNTMLNSIAGVQLKNKTLLMYSDTVFRRNVINKVVKSKSEIVIAVDSMFESRYSTRSNNDIKKAEVIKFKKRIFNKLACEFSGLILFNKDFSKIYPHKKITNFGENLIDFVRFLIGANHSIEFIDCANEWAELNEPEDITRFMMGTKAETLSRLSPLSKTFNLIPQINFSYKEWLKSEKKIIKSIQSKFKGKLLAIRSSSLLEDSWVESQAGKNLTLLGIDSKVDINISNSINKVFNSYSTKIEKNQVLIQEFISDVSISGVVLTSHIDTGAQYCIFNYDDDTGTTDKITGGNLSNSKTLVSIFSSIDKIQKIDKRLNKLPNAIKEIIQLLGFNKLDIEFAITKKKKLILFQVRPICVEHRQYEILYSNIPKYINLNKNKFHKLTSNKKSFYSDMADWNPAEMIGSNPSPLAFDLYKFLITNKNWLKQRFEFGYHVENPKKPLMVEFCGHPYIDLRQSFSSFIPNKLNKSLKNKILKIYLDYLKNNKNLHDKVEFEVMFTSWTPHLKKDFIRRFGNKILSPHELSLLDGTLLEITREAFLSFKYQINIDLLSKKRINLGKNSEITDLDKALYLLEDCKKYGILPFAHAARHAFIAQTFIKSFQNLNILSEKRINDFNSSISTIAKDFCNDQILYNLGKVDINFMIKKYGHLRPGTYDIKVESYKENPSKYFRSKSFNRNYSHDNHNFKITDNESKLINDYIRPLALNINSEQFFCYLTDAIKQRELLKFEFTKNVSNSLTYLTTFGKQYGLSTQMLSNLVINDFKRFKKGKYNIEDLKRISSKRAYEHEIKSIINLPPVITSDLDFECFMIDASLPNYITNKIVSSELLHIDKQNYRNISSKVLLIDHADPGFDWIFNYDISGFITSYGGANSHMAIRAAELGIPAVIGVGPHYFKKLLDKSFIHLNCKIKTMNFY